MGRKREAGCQQQCPGGGSYRLVECYGAEVGLIEMAAVLSANCPKRNLKRFKGEHPHCGAHWPDIDGRPEPEPPKTTPPAPALRVVGGRR